MQRLKFPLGSQTALVAEGWSLSFDDLELLRNLIADRFWAAVPTGTARVLGCLRDDIHSLLALLSITELVDFMPINPSLADTEIIQLVRETGADVVVLSREFFEDKKHLFEGRNLIVLNWDDIVEAAKRNLALPSPIQTQASQCRETGEGRLILHTSGTTGSPKKVPISIESMNMSAKNIAVGHQLQQSDLALNALPTYHIGALVDVLLAPFSVGGSVAITNKRTPVELATEIIAIRPTWVQLVPTILRSMVEDLEPSILKDAGSSLLFIRSVSAPVAPDLKLKAEKLLGCPIVEMYGMTETAGQITTAERIQDPGKIGSVGKPDTVNVALFDGFGNIVKPGQVGEVCVTGPTVFQGYEGTSKAEVFFDDWFRTGDLGQFDADGYLYLCGRLKEMINVGGEKVSPYEIEKAAALFPEVLEAAAYALPHPTLGEQVGLTIACDEGTDLERVMDHLKGELANFKCPRKISRVGQLPRLANSKVDRLLLKRNGDWALGNRLASHTVSSTTYRPKRQNSAVIAGVWTAVLNCRLPEADDDFFDMGGDSLSATNLILELQDALNREISPSQLFMTPTFDSLVKALSQTDISPDENKHPAILFVKQQMAGWPGQISVDTELFRGLGTLKSKKPLFWASQSADEILQVSELLGKNRPLYVTRSLFRFKNRSELDFLALGVILAAEIDEIQPEGDILLGGFCGGAWVMHYAADRLIEMGRMVKLLISFDYWPDRITDFPVFHGMTQSTIHSARKKFNRFDLALPLLHPKGARTVFIESEHGLTAASLEPHLALLNDCFELPNSAVFNDEVEIPFGRWTLAQRREPPSAAIRAIGFPIIYSKNETRNVQIAIKNTSQKIWAPTELSGLSLVIDLLNIDMHVRLGAAGYGEFSSSISPGEEAILTFDLQFPNKKLPLIAQITLVSQGVARFENKLSGGRKILILPNILK